MDQTRRSLVRRGRVVLQRVRKKQGEVAVALAAAVRGRIDLLGVCVLLGTETGAMRSRAGRRLARSAETKS